MSWWQGVPLGFFGVLVVTHVGAWVVNKLVSAQKELIAAQRERIADLELALETKRLLVGGQLTVRGKTICLAAGDTATFVDSRGLTVGTLQAEGPCTFRAVR